MNEKNLRPPWKPGESGNPKGKPKGTKGLSTILRSMLEEGNRGAIICKVLIESAESGDLQSIKEIFDRIDGKPSQSIDMDVTNRDSEVIDTSSLSDKELETLEKILDKTCTKDTEQQ